MNELTNDIIYDAILWKIEYTIKKRLIEKDPKLSDLSDILIKVSNKEILSNNEYTELLRRLEYSFKKEYLAYNWDIELKPTIKKHIAIYFLSHTKWN